MYAQLDKRNSTYEPKFLHTGVQYYGRECNTAMSAIAYYTLRGSVYYTHVKREQGPIISVRYKSLTIFFMMKQWKIYI